jgi:hypothetical protein
VHPTEGRQSINLVRGVGEAGQTPHWFIRCRRPTELVQGRDTLVRDTISKGGFVQGVQHPRIFGRGHIGRGQINPASKKWDWLGRRQSLSLVSGTVVIEDYLQFERVFSCKNLFLFPLATALLIGDYYYNRQSESKMFLSAMTATIYWRI